MLFNVHLELALTKPQNYENYTIEDFGSFAITSWVLNQLQGWGDLGYLDLDTLISKLNMMLKKS